jgi:CRISPR-associated protein (TIGR03984 family)
MRDLVDYGFTAETHLELSNFATDIGAWFAGQPTVGEQAWLLAYAEDGVIWGKLVHGKMVLPRTGAPTLSALTLLEVRLFGEQGEIHIWRSDAGFSGCRVMDRAEANGAFDEWQRLWGTDADNAGNPGAGFTLLVDGREGLRHAVPLEVRASLFAKRPTRFHPGMIQTRHYFQVDGETGMTSIALSRLVSLQAESFDDYRKRVKYNE